MAKVLMDMTIAHLVLQTQGTIIPLILMIYYDSALKNFHHYHGKFYKKILELAQACQERSL